MGSFRVQRNIMTPQNNDRARPKMTFPQSGTLARSMWSWLFSSKSSSAIASSSSTVSTLLSFSGWGYLKLFFMDLYFFRYIKKSFGTEHLEATITHSTPSVQGGLV